MRRTDMFSPMVAILSLTVSSTVLPAIGAAFSASMPSTPSAASAIARAIS